MARYEITGPDGAKYEITAPDGASEQEILAFVQKSLGATDASKEASAPAKSKELGWSDVPTQAISNIPTSAAKFAHDIVQPILHPIETGKGLFNVGYGLASKAYGLAGGQQDPATKAQDEATVNALGEALKGRYGSLDAIKNTLATDPVGVAGDASAILSGGGTAASRLPGVFGRVGEVAATAGRVTDPLNAVAATAKGAGKVVAPILGTTSGTGTAPIQGMYEAGKAANSTALEHMRGARPIDEVVDMAEKGLGSLVQDRGKAYRAGTEELRNTPTPVDFTPVDRTLQQVGDTLHHKGIVKDPKASAVHTAIVEKLQDFKALPPAERTAEALDALKQSVGAIRDAIPFEQKNARRVAGEVYKAIGDEIRRQVPSYAAAMKGYSEASDTINEIGKTLSVGGKATTDTTLRKLQSVMRNNVNTNYGARAKLAEEISKTQPNFLPALAGQAMNNLAPRGLANIGPGMGIIHAATSFNPLSLAMLPLSSPRAIGEAAYGLGRGVKVAKDVKDAVRGDTLLKLLGLTYRGSNAIRPAISAGILED